MLMALHQPSRFMVILIPLDREARDWMHTLRYDGAPVANHLTPTVAEAVLESFAEEGGLLVPH